MMEPAVVPPAPAAPVNFDPPVETIFNRAYIVTINGLVRLLCLVMSATTFICAAVWNARGDNPAGAGWVIFVSISSLLMSLVFYLFHFFNVYQKVLIAAPQWLIVELVAHGLYTIMYLVAGIVAAVYSAEHPATAASCVFCYISMVCYAVEMFFSFQAFRSYTPPPVPTPRTTTLGTPQSGPPASSISTSNPVY